MKGNSRINLGTYIVVSIWFGCNNDCTICMLSGMKGELVPIDYENYRNLLQKIKSSRRFENLILSGAEVTTFPDLGRFVRYAASLDWFKKIQIQTNGRNLADRRFLRHLVACGVNEFFVSIHGLETAHDAVVRVPGAFAETVAGLDHIEDLGVNVITNTVLTQRNIGQVPDLFAFLFRRNINEVHLWNYYPMERKDTQDLVVGMASFKRLLPRLVAMAERFGKPLVLKSFPECLSIGPPGHFDSLYPETVLPARFWKAFDACGFGKCIHRGPCENHFCWGLSDAYIEKYGNEREMLSPMRTRAALTGC